MTTQTIYDHITNAVVTAIRTRAHRFTMPWHLEEARPAHPENISNNRPYKAINRLSLWIAQKEHGYPTGRWGTRRQWRDTGGQVRRGEIGTPLVSVPRQKQWGSGSVPSQVKNPAQIDTAPFLSVYPLEVYNLAQVDNPPSFAVYPLNDPVSACPYAESFAARAKATIREGTHADYLSDSDTIVLPDRGLFLGTPTSTPSELYCAALLYELIRWTGHPSRLNRANSSAFEALVADLGTAFMCANLGIVNTPLYKPAAYVMDWLAILNYDHHAIFIAAAQAEEATSYLFNL